MPTRSTVSAALLASFVVLSLQTAPAHALSWRIYAGWDECVTAHIPDNQWQLLQRSLKAQGNGSDPGSVPTSVVIEAGFLVADEYGSESYRGAVDVSVIDPMGGRVYTKEGLQDDEFEVNGYGTKGPWKLCFKVNRSGMYRPPSLLLELSYFTINHRSLVGTTFEWQKTTSQPLAPHEAGIHQPRVDTDEFASHAQVQEINAGLQRLDVVISGVEHEQRYLHLRTSRHLHTVKSTYTRTLYYHLGIYAVIVAASLVQVAGVRYMFANTSGLPTLTRNFHV